MDFTFGKTHIKLYDKLSFHWAWREGVFARGFVRCNGRTLSGEALVSYLRQFSSVEELASQVCNMDGQFNIIVLLGNSVFACVDPVRSMPLFFTSSSDSLTITDMLAGEPNFTIDGAMLNVFKNALFVPGNKTLFKEIYQIPCGQYLIGTLPDLQLRPYFTYHYEQQQITSLEEAIPLLDHAYQNTFQRVIEQLSGRTAVIPLSGGHDSRLIAFYLKKMGYQNIIAYSYGLPGNEESSCSRQVAKFLGIPWYFVNYQTNHIRKQFKEEFSAFSEIAGNSCAVPCLQEWYAIRQLKQKNIIDPQSSVLIPGYTGDFFAGNHLKEFATTVLSDEIIDYIIGRYYGERGIPSESDTLKIHQTLLEEFDILNHNSFTAAQANEIVETFDLYNRQAKFIVNAVRVYDFYGFEWLLPFFEREQFDTWSKIDNCLRYDRRAFFALEKCIYPADLQRIPYSTKKRDSLIKRRIKQLRYGLAYAHYCYSYFGLSKVHLIDARKGALPSVNMFTQDSYLSMLISTLAKVEMPL